MVARLAQGAAEMNRVMAFRRAVAGFGQLDRPWRLERNRGWDHRATADREGCEQQTVGGSRCGKRRPGVVRHGLIVAPGAAQNSQAAFRSTVTMPSPPPKVGSGLPFAS